MKMKYKIAQISDIHISGSPGPYRGLKVRPNFLKALTQIKQYSPDLLVVSGDLAAEYGEPGAYRWVKLKLEKLPFKTVCIPGNHDIPHNMDNYLMEYKISKTSDWHYSFKLGRYQLIFLDSTDNCLPKNQINWLKNLSFGKYYNLVFMHHPPVKMGCHFMDANYALKNIPEALKTLEAIPQLQHVFCGHYHSEKSASCKHFSVHICPSTAYQINQFNSKFKIESYQAGWRSIELEGKTMKSACHYV